MHMNNIFNAMNDRAAIVFPAILVTVLVLVTPIVSAQPHLTPSDRVIFYTEEWDGPRDSYGRPLVSEEILERMAHVGVEEAWSALREFGYENQLESNWQILWPDTVMVGRALTTAFLPRRPELDERMTAMGRAEGFGGGTNQWPIGMLVEGDVIVVDHYGKLREAAFLGDNLAQAVYSQSGNGAVIYGQARDISGVRQIEGFNTWSKAWHPSSSAERMLASINEMIRIGEAVVLPGDVVLATEAGVIFIPPHLAESVIVSSEVIRLVDGFRIEMMALGRYSSQQIYAQQWTAEVESHFLRWLASGQQSLAEQYNVGMELVHQILQHRNRNWREW